MQVEARAEVEVPEHLISAEHLDQLMAEHQPRFLATATSTSKEDIPVIPQMNPLNKSYSLSYPTASKSMPEGR